MLKRIFVVLLVLFSAACGTRPTLEPTPTATLRPTITATPCPTPTPTAVPNCPARNANAVWTPPAQFAGYPLAIQAYLSGGGTREGLATILRDASSLNDQWGSVQALDLGDGSAATVISIFDPLTVDRSLPPGGMLLVYGCDQQRAVLLYSSAPLTIQPLPRIVQIGNLIGAPHGQQLAIVTSSCGANTCFDRLSVLGWNGQAVVDLLSMPLELPSAQYQFVQADADPALEIEAQRGQQGSIGAGPQRTEKQKWDWNGAQYVEVSGELSPVEYRIHAVYEGDDAFRAGDYQHAIDWYGRVLTDDSLKDWLTEINYPKAHDRDTLKAYARFRLLLIGLLHGDANARDQLDQLSAEFPADSPVHDTQQMAQTFWDKYQATKNLAAACAAANNFANDKFLIVDDLNLFGYTNRAYTSDDMCPIR